MKRDIVEKQLTEQMRCSNNNSLLQRINMLDSDPDFVLDCRVHDIALPSIIMYKYRTGGDHSTMLVSDDGERGYEFLIETDKDVPHWGIYFGMRGIILSNDSAAAVTAYNQEWDMLKQRVFKELNNQLGGDFSLRCEPADNVNDGAYWPFWFRLGPGEDVRSVAVGAVKIIYDIYRQHLSGEISTHAGTPRHTSKKRYTAAPFTLDAYHALEQLAGPQAGLLRQFIATHEASGMLTHKSSRATHYWQWNGTETAFATLVARLCDSLDINTGTRTTPRRPWTAFQLVFKNTNGEPFSNLRKSYNQRKTRLQ